VFWLCSGIVEINPTDEVYLGCGSESPVDASNILDRLEANIAIVWSEDKASKVAMISIDSLFLGSALVDGICTGLTGTFKKEEIFLAATHTHTAPMIDETKPRLGIRNDNYARMLVEKIVQAVSRIALETPTSVTLAKYTAKLGGVVQRRNNRMFELSRFGLKLNPTLQRPNLRRKAIGAEATFAEFLDDSGNVMTALGVIPCHPVAFMGRGFISADYVAGLRTEFRESVCAGRETPFVFLQGASGDLNPWWKPSWLDEGLVKVIDQFVNGVRFPSPAFSIEDLRQWCKLRIQELVSERVEYLRSPTRPSNGVEVESELHVFPLADFLKDAAGLKTRQVYLHQLRIGCFSLLGVSAEVTSELKKEIGDHLGNAELVGCIRDSFGYAASSRQYQEGGYEVEGHQWHFSITHLDAVHPGQLLQRAILGLTRNA
jgi:neutral ceramidase